MTERIGTLLNWGEVMDRAEGKQMTPEELGRIAFLRADMCIDWDDAHDNAKGQWISIALAVAAAVKREDAELCEQVGDDRSGQEYEQAGEMFTEAAYTCAEAIRETIPGGK
jgi:hypothetical protein